jgi:hypothetical protein
MTLPETACGSAQNPCLVYWELWVCILQDPLYLSFQHKFANRLGFGGARYTVLFVYNFIDPDIIYRYNHSGTGFGLYVFIYSSDDVTLICFQATATGNSDEQQ